MPLGDKILAIYPPCPLLSFLHYRLWWHLADSPVFVSFHPSLDLPYWFHLMTIRLNVALRVIVPRCQIDKLRTIKVIGATFCLSQSILGLNDLISSTYCVLFHSSGVYRLTPFPWTCNWWSNCLKRIHSYWYHHLSCPLEHLPFLKQPSHLDQTNFQDLRTSHNKDQGDMGTCRYLIYSILLSKLNRV